MAGRAERGLPAVVSVLTKIESGRWFSDAFEEVTGRTVSAYSEEFRRRVAERTVVVLPEQAPPSARIYSFLRLRAGEPWSLGLSCGRRCARGGARWLCRRGRRRRLVQRA
ncbi:MAG: hypothetical protein U0531_19555 [Dehalococcoidia bacterium]